MKSPAFLISLSIQDRAWTEIPAECEEEEGLAQQQRLGETHTHTAPTLERALGLTSHKQ